MKEIVFSCILLLVVINLSAYSIGQCTQTYTDPVRNRQINTVIFYPIDENQPELTFPYIVFGHGWLVNYTFTQTLTDAMVNLGWIVAHPRTEEGLFPDHQEFASDLSFLKGAVISENLNNTSPLYNKIDSLAVVMGYSMGGGCSVLAASTGCDYASIVTLAAAETNVSAISAAANVTIPSITFSGSTDNVAPASTNQLPIYNNLASDYKSFISITGAGHLNLFSNNLIPVILAPWFEYLKTGHLNYISAFESTLSDNSYALTYQIQNNLPVNNQDDLTPLHSYDLITYPNPIFSSGLISFKLACHALTEIEVYNLKGQLIRNLYKSPLNIGKHEIAWDGKDNRGSRLSAGLYIISLKLNNVQVSTAKVILIK